MIIGTLLLAFFNRYSYILADIFTCSRSCRCVHSKRYVWTISKYHEDGTV